MANKNFSINPTINITRSKFIRNSQHKTSFNLGEIVPIYVDEVLPGDSRNFSIAELIRMSTPIAPIMDNIYLDVYAFFVPNRLVWDKWKEFMGENNTSGGIYSGTPYSIPTSIINALGTVGCLGDHFGLPVNVTGSNPIKVSVLPVRGYRLIYNTWFRDQNVEAPLTINLSSVSNSFDSPMQGLQNAYKLSDYFTRSLPYAQKGAPVSLPLGTLAPVIPGSTHALNPTSSPLTFRTDIGTLPTGTSKFLAVSNTGTLANTNNAVSSGSIVENLVPANLYADLSSATAATINDLRFAFQYQKLLERDAMYGTRYWEILKGHFGISAPDATLQIPEFLGHQRININVDQVIQTTGIDQATPSQNTLGQTAAISCTGGKANLFNKSFCEHGHIFVLAVARQENTYGQGINRMWSRSSRTDFYFPEFANLGAQKVVNRELFVNGTSADDQTFGFQEAWAEYRYKPSLVTGLLNPANSNSLGYWTLASNFNVTPTLGVVFLKESRSNLSRALSTGATGPDFIADFAFKDIAVRPMPIYSVPGLIDHH